MSSVANLSVYSSIQALATDSPEVTLLNCKDISESVVGGFAVILANGEVVLLPKDTIITIKEVEQ